MTTPSNEAEHPYEYVLFVDESGDLGLKPESQGGAASSTWFALGGVVVARKFEADMVDWVRDLRFALHVGAGPGLHYKNLDADRRPLACELASNLKMRGFVVLSHKQNMRGYTNTRAAKMSGQAPFYNFMLRVLLERVTAAVARSTQKQFGGWRKLKIVLGQTGGVYYSQTRAYVELLRSQAFNHATYLSAREVEPRVLDFNLIEPVSAQSSSGVQIADLVVSAFYDAVDANGAGISLAPAVALSPIMAKEHGTAANFGVQLLPWSGNIPDEFRPIFRHFGQHF